MLFNIEAESVDVSLPQISNANINPAEDYPNTPIVVPADDNSSNVVSTEGFLVDEVAIPDYDAVVPGNSNEQVAVVDGTCSAWTYRRKSENLTSILDKITELSKRDQERIM